MKDIFRRGKLFSWAGPGRPFLSEGGAVVWRDNTVFADFTSKGGHGDSEGLGRPGSIPSQLAEGVLDMFFFHAVEGKGRETDRGKELIHTQDFLDLFQEKHPSPRSHNSFDQDVFQIAHITLPVMCHEPIDHAPLKLVDFRSQFPVDLTQEMIDELRDV